MNTKHNLTTSMNVARAGRIIRASVKGIVTEVDNHVSVVVTEARNADTGESLSLSPTEANYAHQALTRLVEKGWAEASRKTLLDLANKLSDDKYAAAHPVPRDAAMARRSDANALARLVVALDNDLRGGLFPAPDAWVKPRRDPNEMLSQHAPAAFDAMCRLAEVVSTLPGATYEALAVEAKGVASRAGYSLRAARH